MILEDETGCIQAKMLEDAIARHQDRLAELTAEIFNGYQDESRGIFETSYNKVPETELSKSMQECLVRYIAKAISTAFESGWLAGMNVAFDIVEAKAMELNGKPCSTVN